MKFYPHNNLIIKEKVASAVMIKHSYSQFMNIFVEAIKKLWKKSLFCSKTQMEALWRIADKNESSDKSDLI